MNTPDPLKPILEKLLDVDDLTLLEKLGMRGKAVQIGTPSAVGYDPVLVHDAGVMGPLDDLRELGRRLVGRWNRELFKVMCGDDKADQKDRESLLQSIGLGDVAIASAVTAVLVSSFAVAPAIAIVIAALVVKRIISPGGAVACEFWAEKLAKE